MVLNCSKQTHSTVTSHPATQDTLPALTLSSTNTLKIFLMSKLKACLAERQKFFPCIAHIMYAFLLMNFMNFSRHQKKQRRQHMIAFTQALSYLLNLWFIYSSMTRIMRQMARIREPNARVPKW